MSSRGCSSLLAAVCPCARWALLCSNIILFMSALYVFGRDLMKESTHLCAGWQKGWPFGSTGLGRPITSHYYYYFIFASQHDPLAPLSRETSTPHCAGRQ
jgi:hypothetical protein